MPANQSVRTNQNLVDNPDRIGPALAQVIHVEPDRDIILGQAWLAAPGRLVTCGHVVDQFAADPSGLFLYFPTSGKRYPVQEVRLHPNFVREPDGLVKYDVAILSVQLTAPDSLAQPLPFSYEHDLRVNQPLWTIRFPVHLGQFSGAMQPLSQDGRFLGLLRKHDSFHLLHDVPLAPGDSGAPITDGKTVVAIHCGDTATLPGLNLPTTSIRLGLWIDALRDLNMQETRRVYITRASRIMPAVVALLISSVAAFALVSLATQKSAKGDEFIQPEFSPLTVRFNHAPDDYKANDPLDITVTPGSPAYVFVFMSQKGQIAKLFPHRPDAEILTRQEIIDTFAGQALKASETDMKITVVAANSENEDASRWARSFLGPEKFASSEVPLLKAKHDKVISEVKAEQAKLPGEIYIHTFDLEKGK